MATGARGRGDGRDCLLETGSLFGVTKMFCKKESGWLYSIVDFQNATEFVPFSRGYLHYVSFISTKDFLFKERKEFEKQDRVS